jgi:hypothetical protein
VIKKVSSTPTVFSNNNMIENWHNEMSLRDAEGGNSPTINNSDVAQTKGHIK